MFGKLGQLADLMKNAQTMQENMKKVKAELASLELSGKSADGQVEVWATGEMNVTRMKIQPSLIESGDAAAVEKAVTDAVNTALYLVKIEAARRFSDATGGMKLPDGLA